MLDLSALSYDLLINRIEFDQPLLVLLFQEYKKNTKKINYFGRMHLTFDIDFNKSSEYLENQRQQLQLSVSKVLVQPTYKKERTPKFLLSLCSALHECDEELTLFLRINRPSLAQLVSFHVQLQ